MVVPLTFFLRLVDPMTHSFRLGSTTIDQQKHLNRSRRVFPKLNKSIFNDFQLDRTETNEKCDNFRFVWWETNENVVYRFVFFEFPSRKKKSILFVRWSSDIYIWIRTSFLWFDVILFPFYSFRKSFVRSSLFETKWFNVRKKNTLGRFSNDFRCLFIEIRSNLLYWAQAKRN